MAIWLTEYKKINGSIWCGDDIEAETEEEARKILDLSYRKYMKIAGKLVIKFKFK